MRISYSLVSFALCLGFTAAAAIPYRHVSDAVVVLESTLWVVWSLLMVKVTMGQTGRVGNGNVCIVGRNGGWGPYEQSIDSMSKAGYGCIDGGIKTLVNDASWDSDVLLNALEGEIDHVSPL